MEDKRESKDEGIEREGWRGWMMSGVGRIEAGGEAEGVAYPECLACPALPPAPSDGCTRPDELRPSDHPASQT